jgi:RNA polymerase sigma-70 factor (ECF subfamily)
VQDIFLKIWQHRESLPQINHFSDYLFIIARNHIIGTLRKKIHEQPFTDHLAQYCSDTASDPEHQLLYRETELLLHKAVEQLPPQQQLIFRLSREQGLSQAEIAEKLQISRNTIKSHMNKALHSIRQYLQAHTQAEAFVLLYCIVTGLY